MFGIDTILGAGLKIIEKLIPDEQERARLQLEMLKLNQQGEFKELDIELAKITAQTEVNKVEAASSSIFVSGWRPAIGWICGAALAYQYLIRPFLIGVFGYTAMPSLDDNLWELLMGMLGLGGLRTFEKIKGVAKQ